MPASAGASDKPSSGNTFCGFSSKVRFAEGAPRDRFTVQNNSASDWQITTVNLDMSSSAGNLIFDVTADGAGVEVFQPFRSEDGEATLSAQPVVDDGDQIIILEFSSFSPGDQHQFSIDVDDQLSQSELGQIRVSGGEITGASITLGITNQSGDEHSVSGLFDDSSWILLDSGNC